MQETIASYIDKLRRDFNAFCDVPLHQLGLTNGLLYFLIYIGKYPGCSPGGISTDLNADTGHTTRSIEKLVNLGYVQRCRKEQDKRVMRLSLTKTGQETFQALRELLCQWDERICHSLTDLQREELTQLLQLIWKEAEGDFLV